MDHAKDEICMRASPGTSFRSYFFRCEDMDGVSARPV
jgi:hypothetical protein